MAARMKVEDRCCKKAKAALGYDLFRPERTAVTILSSPFLPGEARDKRDFFFGGGKRGGGCSQNGKWERKKEGCEARGRKECGIGVVKAAGFLDIIY